MTRKITIINGYTIAVDGKVVEPEARTKDHAYDTACTLQASLAAVGTKAEIEFVTK